VPQSRPRRGKQTRLTNRRKIKILHDMDTLKKSKKRSRKTPDVHQHDVAKFEIMGIEVKGIPNVRVKNQPVQPRPTPPTPPPTPPPPPPPGQ